MARNLKPKWKQNRREGYTLFGSEKWQKRQGLPGIHPNSRRKPTDFAVQFREKQKVKKIYGLLEKQFSRFFNIAAKSKSNTGVRFLQMLELRLDNVIYRLGVAPSRASARQLVNHGFVLVNDKKIDVSSHIVKVGDIITLKPRIKKHKGVLEFAKLNKNFKLVKWLKKSPLGGEILAMPMRDMIDKGINERLIVEYYSK